MYKIYKLSLHSTVEYAAQELKKYLQMMMLSAPEIDIVYDPQAKDGFRLGLMQQFSLDVSDVEDTNLDDILYIDADEAGGIIAGDNPRSVLLAVYEYLRQQGCRWLFPGVDGEFIPEVEGLVPVKLRHVPSCRFRGQCNEGAEYQQDMLEAIEFTPKVGMNVFMQEFKVPVYYRFYYQHIMNEENRPPEEVSKRQIMQWKRHCEAEIAKRGLQYHDMGHGWTADSFGIDSSLYTMDGNNDEKITPEQRKYIAMVRGERKVVNNRPNHTQACMSNPEVREKMVKYAADYAQAHTNVDYLHFWLGDAINHHCECESCLAKTPSDWYMDILNDLDEELTARGLDTRIVFIAYTDTVWAPVQERIRNSKRFTLLYAPISRSYTQPLTGDATGGVTKPYERNKNVMPKKPADTFAYFNKWKEVFQGAIVAYEYHFWKHFVFDVGGVALAPIINEDIRGYKRIGINGIIEDGSQRAFFPTGFNFYVYARTLYDNSLTTEELAQEYFSCAFGEDWREFYGYLQEISHAFDHRYMEGELSSDMKKCIYYNPDMAEKFATVRDVVAKGRKLIESHYNMPHRVQTMSVRMLELHAKYCEMIADALALKCQGKDQESLAALNVARIELGKLEAAFQTVYDHHLQFNSLTNILKMVTRTEEPQIYN